RQVRDRQPSVVVALHVGQAARQQGQLAVGHALIDVAVDLVDVDAGLDEVGGHEVSPGAGVLIHEAARVGDEPHVERVGDGAGRRHAQVVHQIPDDLGGARRLGDHEVHGPEVGVVVMVVDVEDVQGDPTGPAEGLGRVAVDVAAVQEHDRAVADVGGGLGGGPPRGGGGGPPLWGA